MDSFQESTCTLNWAVVLESKYHLEKAYVRRCTRSPKA